MRKLITRMAVGALLMLIALAPLGPATGQVLSLPEQCKQLAFSTEEDFVTQGPVPPDGNPIISDGDLLALYCVICARNLQLVGSFNVTQDLGLDAADVIDMEEYLVAFSTELDSPIADQFTAGDLLVINGNIVIPNIALTYLFGVGYDIGLDSLHFVGDPQDIVAFLNAVLEGEMSRGYWLEHPGDLPEMLAEYEMDIWFSTEGTWTPAARSGFLDGDLLSARDGTIVAENGELLPSGVPAGIPDRGVDFGLDAVTSNRAGGKERIHFSTEILYQDGLSFTDGDVLKYGDGVSDTNKALILCFEPKADFLGLDALHMALEGLLSKLYLPLILKTFDQSVK